VRASRALRRGALATLTGAAGTQLGLVLGARASGRVGPVTVHAAAGLARAGGTDVDLGLLGGAHVPTHAGPLRPAVRLGALDLDAATRLADPDRLADARGAAFHEAGALMRRLGARAAIAGIAGAATATALVTHRATDTAAASLGAAAVLGAAGLRATRTHAPGAWRDAAPSGPLVHAPKILGDLRSAPERLDRYRAQLVDLLGTATEVARAVAELPDAPEPDSIRLVHVSDIHLSPLVLPLVEVLVAQYGARAVIDTGDLVDWGTAAEDAVADRIRELGVPYVYVKGNHDSAGTARAVARQPNATVLDGTVAEVAGVRIAGMADPRHTSDKTTGDDHGMPKVRTAARHFADLLRGMAADIALAHSPAAAAALAGLVPLVLAGDVHHRAIRHLDGGTILVVQGSSGGAGLRGVQQDPPVPLELSVLHLDRATRRLRAIDEVTLGGIGATDVRIARRTVAAAATGSGG